MKSVLVILIVTCISSGCLKNEIFSRYNPIPGTGPELISPGPDRMINTDKICINRYDSLVRYLGTSAAVVSQVELEDGSLISTGGKIINIQYAVLPVSSSQSFFESKLKVDYAVDSHVQTFLSVSGSAGCTFPKKDKFYTNIIKGNKTFVINANLLWGAPPFVAYAPGIRYLYIKQ